MAYSSTTFKKLYPSPTLDHDLLFVGKCYIPEKVNPDGVTLLFFHAAGSHKETFEPIIGDLFALKSPDDSPIVREAWSFDMQSHGEAGAFNNKRLGNTTLSVTEWTYGFKAFMSDSDVLRGHKLVAVGHSLGASMIILATMEGPLPPVDLKSLIIVEPALVTQEAWDQNKEMCMGALALTSAVVMKRRDVWNSREEAKKYFDARPPWKGWDPRVVVLYTQHALTEIEENGVKTEKVTLACAKIQENAAFCESQNHLVAVAWLLTLAATIPVHVILGEDLDVVPEFCHQSVIGIKDIKSIQTVSNAGHFVVQQNPKGLGLAIAQVVSGTLPPRPAL
ncbi:alpha/beta-hydrolase [Dichomitus squalens]|uniref:Alpha/beta-hydrolase n=1 Tax=Dichomitus squalens TaxID=114155 RepID=A0A4Q9MFC5_9APHY|nr:alpha/beta-hydrolase [Dichomitus squalens]